MTPTEEKSASRPMSETPLRHLVLFRFRGDAPDAEVREIERMFRELPQHIGGITALEWGRNHSAEGLDQGFTHCFLLTFRDAAARDAYLPHPAHLAFVARLKPVLDGVLVVDYHPASED
jgi:hypothetical protein